MEKKNNPTPRPEGITRGVSRRNRSFEFRMETTEDKERVIRGHGAVFNSLSEDLGGFREMIHPGAFDEAIKVSDVRCLFNHNADKILGSTKAGTLRLSIDETGLAYECTLPDTNAGRDLAVSLDRGDISQSSFAFTMDWSDERTEDNPDGAYGEEYRDGRWELHIYRVKELFDVSPVTYPAYKAADVRSAGQVIQRAKDRMEDAKRQAAQETEAAKVALQSAAAARSRRIRIHELQT